MLLPASAGDSTVPAIARLVQTDDDTVRDVIHRFNEIGLACLNPQWAGGRPRLLSGDDEDFVIQTDTTRPTQVGKPFTRWSIRELAEHLRRNIARPIRIRREDGAPCRSALDALLGVLLRTRRHGASPSNPVLSKPRAFASSSGRARAHGFDRAGKGSAAKSG